MSGENDNKPLEEVKSEVKAEETQEVCPAGGASRLRDLRHVLVS